MREEVKTLCSYFSYQLAACDTLSERNLEIENPLHFILHCPPKIYNLFFFAKDRE